MGATAKVQAAPAFDSTRTEKTFRFLAYRRPLSIVSISVLSFTLIHLLHKYNLDSRIIDNEKSWTSSCFILLLNIPAWIVLVAFLLPMKSDVAPPTSSNQPRRQFQKLYISIVTRGSNPEAVIRSCTQMSALRSVDPRVRLTILTDEPVHPAFRDLGVDVVATPASFKPPRARYKARALEWFRTSCRLRDDEWVLHLDEETLADAHTVRACVRFIEEEAKFDFGQGIILYNGYKFWDHTLPTIADIPRARDDYGKFFLGPSFVHFPIVGLHGSFLLISGKVQNAIGWDTDSAAEDMWFGLEAWKLNLRIGWIPSIVREQSPHSILDSWLQRSRWFGGMPAIPFPWGLINMTLWILETIGAPIIMASWNYLKLPYWAYIMLVIVNVTDLWSMTYACLVQDIDAGISLWRTIYHAILYSPLALISKWTEGIVIAYTIVNPPKGFYIVKK